MDLKSRYLARGRAIDALDLFLWLHFCYESTATNFRYCCFIHRMVCSRYWSSCWIRMPFTGVLCYWSQMKVSQCFVVNLKKLNAVPCWHKLIMNGSLPINILFIHVNDRLGSAQYELNSNSVYISWLQVWKGTKSRLCGDCPVVYNAGGCSNLICTYCC